MRLGFDLVRMVSLQRVNKLVQRKPRLRVSHAMHDDDCNAPPCALWALLVSHVLPQRNCMMKEKTNQRSADRGASLVLMRTRASRWLCGARNGTRQWPIAKFAP